MDYWEAIGPAREAFEVLGPAIKSHLEKKSEPLEYPVTFTIYMVGRSRDKAFPVILSCSKDSASRRKAKKVVQESAILDSHPGIQLGVCKKPPGIDNPSPIANTVINESLGENPPALCFRVFSYKPLRWFCQQIFAQNDDTRQCSTSSSTAGGIIKHHHDYYYMTVAHIFASEESLLGDEEEDGSDFEVELDFDPDIVEEQDESALQRISSTGSLTSSESRDEDISFRGTPTDSSSSPDSISAQETQRSDQVDTGNVNSTGRVSSLAESAGPPSPGPPPETCELTAPDWLQTGTSTSGLDYALLKVASFPTEIEEHFLPDLNGRLQLWPQEVAKSFPADEMMVVLTSRGEVLRGRMSSNPLFRSLPNSNIFQEVWTVPLNGHLVKGDCGLWVVHARTGELCGQIVARSLSTATAYVVPMHYIFDDILRRSNRAPNLSKPQTLRCDTGQGFHIRSSVTSDIHPIPATRSGAASLSTRFEDLNDVATVLTGLYSSSGRNSGRSAAQTPQPQDQQLPQSSPSQTPPTKSPQSTEVVLAALPTARDRTSDRRNEQGDECIPRDFSELNAVRELPLSSAVSAVVSAFRSAAENVQNIRKKSNRFIKKEKTVVHALLQGILEDAAERISLRYSQHSRVVGEEFAVGDDVSRDRLFRIAILMQSDLIRSLQIALVVDHVNLNLSKLQDDALINKRDTLDTLDGLRDRLLRQSGAINYTLSQLHPLRRRPSSESIGTHISSYIMPSNNSLGHSSIRSGSPSFSFTRSEGASSSLAHAQSNIVPYSSTPFEVRQFSQGTNQPQFYSYVSARSSGSNNAISTHTPTSSDAGSLLDRPNKQNNYRGFCKSAWTICEDPKKGLSLCDKPRGFTSYSKEWVCKTCTFVGDVYGDKKPYCFDPNIHVARNGVRYRWIFLAKSHCKKKALEDARYGCMLCAGEGKPTGIFGDVETLMTHIANEHGTGLSDSIREKYKVIYGRVAGADEEWDINIPANVVDKTN